MEILDEATYQLWAENVFFELLKNISNENFTNKAGFSKSLQEIYFHKYEVMWSWFTLLIVKNSKRFGENPLGTPDFDTLNKSDFISEALKLFEQFLDYVKTNKNTSITLDVDWLSKPYSVTNHEIIYNILNHLSYHRGQSAFLFKKFGLEVPETDYNPYFYQLHNLH